MPAERTPAVIDASVAIKWFVPEVHTDAALTYLDDRFERHFPDHFYLEVASTLWKKVVQRGELTEEDGRDILALITRLCGTAHASPTLLEPAFEIALQTRRTIYDSLYIALADRLKCVAVTADEKLLNAVRGGAYAHRVHWVADPFTSAIPDTPDN
jgi:predicted nucleic acid-binding protein